MARITAVIKRCNKSANDDVFRYKGLEINFKGREVIVDSKKASLTPKDVITSYSIHYTKLYDIIDECNKHPEFIGFGTLHPETENMEAEIEKIIAGGLKGVKIHPDFQKFNIDDEKVFSIYELCEGRLPVLVHMGDDRYEFSRPHRLLNVIV